MLALVNTGPNRLEMLERPIPEPSRGEVRIRTSACAICATDIAMIAGWERTPFGAIPGHEWSGMVDAVGDGVDSALIGRKCIAENVWPDGGEVGFEHPGGYAQYFLTAAANVRVLPDDFDMLAATLIEPLSVCLRGFRRLFGAPGHAPVSSASSGSSALPSAFSLQPSACSSASRPGEAGSACPSSDSPGLPTAFSLQPSACFSSPSHPSHSSHSSHSLFIAGDGPIGLLTLMVAISEGISNVVLVGGRDERLALAKALGARATLNYHRVKTIAQAVRDACGESAYPCLIEASGSAAALETCISLASPDAKVLLLGDYGAARAGFEWNVLLHKELHLIGSNASAGAWDDAVALAISGLPLRQLVTHVLPAERFEEAVTLTRQGREGVVKVVMEWSGQGPQRVEQ